MLALGPRAVAEHEHVSVCQLHGLQPDLSHATKRMLPSRLRRVELAEQKGPHLAAQQQYTCLSLSCAWVGARSL